MKHFFLLTFFLLNFSLIGQNDSLTDNLYSVDSGYKLQEIILFGKPDLSGEDDKKWYYYMKFRMKRIYPFFLQVVDMFAKIEVQKKRGLPKNKLEKYLERVEDYVFEKFRDTVMGMTKIEGMMFSKLIYRHTGVSIFEIIDENMGTISSYWWYATAKFFSIDIDEEYCPPKIKRDLWIENILNELLDEERIEVLPDTKGYCIQTKREKQKEDEAKKDTTAHWYEPWNW